MDVEAEPFRHSCSQARLSQGNDSGPAMESLTGREAIEEDWEAKIQMHKSVVYIGGCDRQKCEDNLAESQ